MSELTTHVRDRVILFYDGGYKFITKTQEELFFQASYATDGDGIKVDGDYITFKSVQRIISKDEFYEQHPDKRPQRETVDQFKEQYGNMQIRKPTKRAAEQMKKGFTNFFTDELGFSLEDAEHKYKTLRLV